MAVTPAIVSAGPNEAGPIISNGPFAVLLRKNGSPRSRTFGTSFVTLMPFHETLRTLIDEAARSASVIALQILPVVTSSVYCE